MTGDWTGVLKVGEDPELQAKGCRPNPVGLWFSTPVICIPLARFLLCLKTICSRVKYLIKLNRLTVLFK